MFSQFSSYLFVFIVFSFTLLAVFIHVSGLRPRLYENQSFRDLLRLACFFLLFFFLPVATEFDATS